MHTWALQGEPRHLVDQVEQPVAKKEDGDEKVAKQPKALACLLPKKSPWLNSIEPKWVHTKRKIVEPDRLLSAEELADRVCAALSCKHEDHLPIPDKVA